MITQETRLSFLKKVFFTTRGRNEYRYAARENHTGGRKFDGISALPFPLSFSVEALNYEPNVRPATVDGFLRRWVFFWRQSFALKLHFACAQGEKNLQAYKLSEFRNLFFELRLRFHHRNTTHRAGGGRRGPESDHLM